MVFFINLGLKFKVIYFNNILFLALRVILFRRSDTGCGPYRNIYKFGLAVLEEMMF